MDCPATTRSAGCSGCSIRSSSARRSSGSWRRSPGSARGSGRSMARSCAARTAGPMASRPCTWSVPPPSQGQAWGCEQRLVLGQIATDAKSNEITAVPKLLAMLSLKDTIVTVDALNCQRAIARQIVDQGGNYALALKANQATLHDDVSRFLDDPECKASTAPPVIDADHGRIETRIATVCTAIGWLQETHKWPGLAAIGKVVRT